ncbi:MAG TPA: GNAT family N-acetyltransferase [Thermoplasmata archaeon]|nr:GNAT family N-acetyltransferase [Thermoplasmata archaeon]
MVRRLFRSYELSLSIRLDFQGFAEELLSLPGHYASPCGGLWIAFIGQRPVGCVGVRPLSRGRAELKRLYVLPGARGRGVGLRLTRRAIAFARAAGYGSIRLDTLPSMTGAQRLYAAVGFARIPPYRFNPVPDASFWELALRHAAPRGEVRGRPRSFEMSRGRLRDHRTDRRR